MYPPDPLFTAAQAEIAARYGERAQLKTIQMVTHCGLKLRMDVPAWWCAPLPPATPPPPPPAAPPPAPTAREAPVPVDAGLLPGCSGEMVRTLREAKRRLTGEQLHHEMELRAFTYSLTKVKSTATTLAEVGILTLREGNPGGYGLPEWAD